MGKTVDGIVTTDALNIRSGPGTGYDSVGKLYTDEVIKIFYQVTVGETTWHQCRGALLRGNRQLRHTDRSRRASGRCGGKNHSVGQIGRAHV